MSACQRPRRKMYFVRPIVAVAALTCFLVAASSAPADVSADSGEAFGLEISVGGILTFGKFPDAVLPSGGGSASAGAGAFSGSLGALGTIGLLSSTCAVSETSTAGSTTITNGSVTLGASTTTFSGTWDASAGPQTILNVSGLVSLVLNDQSVSVSATHRERTVTAIHLILLPGTVGAVDAIIGQVHCDVDGTILAATFRGASATRTKHGVLVRWATASETDMLGFNVYRQVRGRRVRVNHRLIPAALSLGGHRYSLLDRRAPERRAVRYWIQAVDRHGKRTWYGPTRPVPAS